MRLVVGMETSGAVRNAIIMLGHDAISVDLLPHQHGGPHHEGDLFAFLGRDCAFDGGVFHPECTYHTGSAAWAFNDADFDRYPGVGYHQRVKPETLTGAARRAARADAELDVRRIRYMPFPKIIENPVGTLSDPRNLGRPHQIVQPYEFGSDASKKTCLWFFDGAGEPLSLHIPLDPALRVSGRMVEWPRGSGKMVERWANQTDAGQNALSPGDLRWKLRSDTYPGIAGALAAAITSPHQRTTLL